VRGSLGQILISSGVIDATALADALARQSGRHPVASELYALGYATERELCTALTAQTGWASIVLDESAIQLGVLAHVSLEWARVCNALPVYEDASTIVIAAARPDDAIVAARELATARGKTIELLIALDITLARTVRLAFKRAQQGEALLAGRDIEHPGAYIATVHPENIAAEDRDAQRALAEEAARAVDDLPSEDLNPNLTLTGDWQVNTVTQTSALLEGEVEERTMVVSEELDRGEEADRTAGRTARILVVDPEASSRMSLVAELERLGYECQAAASGPQAVDLMQAMYFDLVFGDIATPELDGLRMCRAIKRSRRLAKVRVVITTSVIDTGQVPEEVLQRHGADGYLEKPIDKRRLHRLLRDLSNDERYDHEAVLADAVGRHHAGDVEGAVSRLRVALVSDPSSPKLHFTLANMLQRSSRWAEAVDEYEAVVELQPTYFPALTRLAYLYFRQGMHARAIETWRRALPVCEDPALRRNIELFMRKLVADLRVTNETLE
jgi:CheY-like chemotaxis protein